MQKVLFIDRDGTLVLEPPIDHQLDSLEKLTFYPGVFRYLSLIAETLDYELVMVTNQDGLGTASFPEATFWPAHNKIMEALEHEGIRFSNVFIDRSFPEEKTLTRKPETGLLSEYLNPAYDLAHSFVIGDRNTDMALAANLGAKGILLAGPDQESFDQHTQVLQTDSWADVYSFLRFGLRKADIARETKETSVSICLNLDGSGSADIKTGIAFLDHMLEQISTHGSIDLDIRVKGDLDVDEHHTIEDTAIALGEAFREALGNKAGLERYGFCLPMDDCLAHVAIDFSGRSWLVWKVVFSRELIGKMPTEMFAHFFKSFSDAAKCNIYIQAEGENEHHKIESIFKAFGRVLQAAVKRDINNTNLPSTKGIL